MTNPDCPKCEGIGHILSYSPNGEPDWNECDCSKSKVYKITPLSNCRFCYGTGEVAEHHPYGSTWATEYLTCDCVLEQLPEDYEDNDELIIDTLNCKMGQSLSMMII